MKKNLKLTIYFDRRSPNIDPTSFSRNSAEKIIEQYRDVMESLPKDNPEPRGRSVTITEFVDASYASDNKTRISHTGYVIFVNRSPVIFYSKRQLMVKLSTFSSEFIANNTCTAHIIALKSKLQMFGVDIDDPIIMLNDN